MKTRNGTERSARLMVVDDEPHQLEMLNGILERAGFEVMSAGNTEDALASLEERPFDLILTDQKMPGMSGLALLDKVRRRFPSLPVVLMTAYGSVSDAVAAMKRGAADYLTKPFDRDELILVIEKVLRQQQLEHEVYALRGALKDRYRLGNIIGQSTRMQEVFSIIERVASTEVPVLIHGESGTGKELVARALHQGSARSEGPFVALNCAAVPETLLESEFFGHERGAFSGAVRAHHGRFEQANGGTLFLDEIGAMRVDLQAKLLRAIQEQEVQRLGSTSPRKVDVRILAATCEDLPEAINERRFREDLYYRLSVVPIELPPLRDRQDDIVLLVDHFLMKSAQKLDRESASVASGVLECLQRYSWPGNVRELENCIERMIILSRQPQLMIDDLPEIIRYGSNIDASLGNGFKLPPQGVQLPELERHLIRQALDRTKGNLSQAAGLLGISYKTLQYRIRKHDLERDQFCKQTHRIG